MHSFALLALLALCAVSMAGFLPDPCLRAPEGYDKCHENFEKKFGLHRAELDTKNLYTGMVETNLVGGDIGGRPDPKILPKYEDCIFDCLKRRECKGFTWDIESRECFLKEGGWISESNSHRISGKIDANEDRAGKPEQKVDDKDGEDRRRKDNYDCPGNDFEEFDGVQLGDCERRCRRQEHHHREQTCRGIAYDPTASHCWLKFKMDNCHPTGNRITIFM